MADISKTIEFIFKSIDNASPNIKNLGSGIEGLGSSLGDITGPIADFSDSLLKLEGAVLAAGAAVAAFSLKQAVDFQSATLDLQKVLDEADGGVQQFAQSAIDLSNKYGVASTQVLQDTANFKQAGFTASEGLFLAEEALKALIITEFKGGEASETFVRILKGFDAPASDAARILDVLNEVSNIFATDSKQLGEAMAKSASIAKLLGFNYEELAAALTPMIENTQDGSASGEAFFVVLQRLISSTKTVREGLDLLRVSQKDANGHLKSGKDILHDVQVAYQHFAPEMKPVVASLLAGKEQAAKMVAVFDNLSKTTDILGVAMNAQGSAQRELEVRMKATETQINKTLQAFNNAAILLGGELLPSFTKLVQATGDVGLALQQIIQGGQVKPLTDLFSQLTESLALVVEEIAKNLPAALKQVDFSGLVKSLRDLTGTVSGLFDGIDVSTPEGLAEAIQRVVDAVRTLTNITAGFAEPIVAVVKQLIEWAEKTNQLSDDQQKLIGKGLGFNQILDSLLPGVQNVGKAIEGLAFVMGANGLLGVMEKLTGLSGSLALGVGGLGAAVLIVSDHYLNWTGRTNDLIDRLLGLQRTLPDITKEIQTQSTETGLLMKAWLALNGQFPGIATETQHLSGFIGALAGGFVDTAAEAAKLEAQAAQNRAGFGEWAKLADELGGKLTFTKDGLAEITIAAGKAAEGNGKLTAGLTDVGTQAALAVTGLDPLLRLIEGVGERSERATDLMKSGFKASGEAIVGTTDAFTMYSHAASKAEDDTNKLNQGLSKTFEQMLAAQKQANEIDLAWAKLAQEDRNLVFKLEADIAIAQIQQGTELVKAAFESINVGIKSTSDVIVGLAKEFAQLNSGSKADELRQLLDDQNQRQQQEFDLQKKLTDSQIQYLNAVTDRLNSGDATIQIDATGVEPIWRELLFSVMKQVQIQASSEAQLLLLGLT